MREELDKQLCERYPKIFADRYKPMAETAMCWGFECGEGWYDIIDLLCSNIQHHINWSEKNYRADVEYNEMILAAQSGDLALLDEYYGQWSNSDEMMTRAIQEGVRKVRQPVPQVVATQIKEKFGTLRFYYQGGDDEISGMVRMAEAMSSRTCEKCGSPGESNNKGWITTLCQKHRDEQDERRLLQQGLEG